jgi:phenylacetate-CoA ligase
MPIIRYKNGDLAQLSTEDCPCGCRLPLIERIIGRSGEDIFLPDGKRIPWNQLKGFMNDSRVRQFQIIQNADGSLTIKYVKEPSADIENLENLIMQRFKTALGENLKIEIVEVRQISPAKSGKSKLVVSHFKPEKI